MMMKLSLAKIGKLALPMIASAAIFSISSCGESFLDIDSYINDQVTIDSVFTSKTRVLQYINGAASFLPDESKIISGGSYSPSGLAADEAIVPWADWNHRGSYLMIDEVSVNDVKGYDIWENMFKGIRKANI